MISDEHTLLAAIAKDPADDTLRLVYADWLDDRNDPRGKFIRIQYALENLALPRKERQQLLNEEAALLAAHRDAWIAKDMQILPAEEREGLNPHYLTFSRGILDVITMTATERQIIRRLHNPELGNPNAAFYALFEGREPPGRERNASTGVTPAELKTLILRGMNPNADGGPLHTTAEPLYAVLARFSKENRLQALQILIDAGANLNMQGGVLTSDSSPLHFIASDRKKLTEEARLLVRNGANTRKPDESGLTVRQYIKEADGDSSPLLAAIQEEERLARQNQGFKGRIPKKGRGFGRGRGGDDAADADA